MKKWPKQIALIAAILLGLSFKPAEAVTTADLYVQLKNIRNTDGVLYVFLYNYENQYPRKPLTYYKVQKSKVQNGTLRVKIENVAFKHQYAITLIDDENNNEDLDRILGIPTEGFGFSNNVRPLFSLPKYNDLLFNFLAEKTIAIDLQYFL